MLLHLHSHQLLDMVLLKDMVVPFHNSQFMTEIKLINNNQEVMLQYHKATVDNQLLKVMVANQYTARTKHMEMNTTKDITKISSLRLWWPTSIRLELSIWK